MSTRDELADEAIALVEKRADAANHQNLCGCLRLAREGVCETYGKTTPWSISHAEAVEILIAEGWRKKPSRDEIIAALDESDPEGGVTDPDEIDFWETQADAILALMDRGQ